MSIKKEIFSLFLTVLILIVFELLTTTLLPRFGLEEVILPFNVLILLYLAFKLASPYLAIHILIICLTHSLFSIEGWEVGAITMILISIIIGYLREIIDLKSAGLTIIITEIFMLVWFALSGGLFLIQGLDKLHLLGRLKYFIFESCILSLAAPMMFSFLDRIWGIEVEDNLKERY